MTRPLTHAEAIARARSIRVGAYAIALDLTGSGPTFGVRTRITFACAEERASTWVEHVAQRLVSVRLNDRDLVIDEVAGDGRIRLDDLGRENVLEVVSDCAYSISAEGLCRFEDPEDGATYVYSMCFLDLAPRVFPCFDQPDMKAPFSVEVRAPEGWGVWSNGPGAEAETGRWVFETTPPLPTYIVGLVAGPWHAARTTHDGMALSFLCRRAMAPHLDSEALFADTIEALDRYRDLFGPYPFAKLDQIFCPNFGGGMENAAMITLGEEYLFRSRPTAAERRNRTELIFHEIAHMWFGDCVTTRWWDDLWLNEAFATYVAVSSMALGPLGTAAWVDFAFMKDGPYREDQMPSTHPVSGTAEDSAAALLNFDGISYVKGASAIKQLAAVVGDDAFRAGVRRLIAEHAFGSIALEDLLAAIGDAAAMDLGSWSEAWLRSSGVGTLRQVVTVDDDGLIGSVAVEQLVPEDHPVLRPHRLELAPLDDRGGVLVLGERVPVDVEAALTLVPSLTGSAAPKALILDPGDLTWAKGRLDDRSFRAVSRAGVWRIEDPLVRARIWMLVRDLVLDAEISVAAVLPLLLDGVARDPDPGIARVLVAHALDAIGRLGRPSDRGTRTAQLAERCIGALTLADGPDHQLVFARGAIDAATAPDQVDLVRGWLDGRNVPRGLTIGPDERWSAIRRLAVLGDADRRAIDEEARLDATATGQERAVTARASVAAPDAKDEAWEAIVGSGDLAYTLRWRMALGFGPPEHDDLVRPFVPRMVPALVSLWGNIAPFGAALVASAVLQAAPIESSTRTAMDGALETENPPGLRRILVERRWELARAMDARTLDR